MRYTYAAVSGLFSTFLLVSGASCTGGATQLPDGLPYNFHVLDEGRAYRSSQPEGNELAVAIESYGIRTVMNLRGENEGKDWYDNEAAICAAMNVTLSNHRMSAKSLPTPEVLAGVIETLQTAEYPILIHCDGGSDRAGAVSAIYRMLIQGWDRAGALTELSPAYLHFRFYAPCMDTLAELYQPTASWLTWYAENMNQITCQ